MSLHNDLDPRKPARCLRHVAWMASCDDCHDAHVEQVRARKRSALPR